ncbi:ATP-dependent DNA helicase, Rep family [Agromyces sp. CF514]|uniref:ATP-dependent helicase n=1 Tax=Agromyces sp. CF514 TaxID=1881031 RepID=UPI0008DEFACF|nr:ATP-dependent helicase [Agromyces sp. CF514]SFR74533.1 ATP-dependent DNA helicase, Rep family [Agromyces sp. CF514]
MSAASDPLLADLDDEQRVAAEALLGPVCILAGAGTGKTRAITHRIAYGVATGTYDPARVMALTFTSRAAAELRERLRVLGADGVPVRTFHAAALAQLNHFWPLVVGGSAPRVLEYKGRLLGAAAESIRLRVDQPTLRDVAAEIEWRKVGMLTPEAHDARLAVRGAPGSLSAEQFHDLVAAYERIKDERRQLDFEDVLLATSGMIEAEASVTMRVHESYRHFVVDEYQDVSPAQQHLLELWLGDRDELCVVGDASQTIYSFAGATPEYLLGFERRFADATVVRLERNYRSTEPIVDAANRLMRGRAGALQLRATARDRMAGEGATVPDAAAPRTSSGHPRGEEPVITSYADELAEARGVATVIRNRIDAGAAPEQIAVLMRVNSQSAMLEHALDEVGVASRVRGSVRFFDQPEVRQAVQALRAAALTIANEPLFKSVSDVLRSLGWTAQAPEGPGAVRARWESLNALARLVDDAPAGMTFRAFADDLRSRAEAQHEPTVQAVTLATLHSAKGLEWDEVHIVGLTEGMLPIAYAKGLDAIDEERRLFYVGVTRARRRLSLSWARLGGQQRAVREESRFLQELDSRTTGAARVRDGDRRNPVGRT